jgi:hypothetical protein
MTSGRELNQPLDMGDPDPALAQGVCHLWRVSGMLARRVSSRPAAAIATVPAGGTTVQAKPISVKHQSGSSVGDATLSKVEVSYDDGGHWQLATLTKTRPGWQAKENQPRIGLGSSARPRLMPRATGPDIRADRLQ